MQNMLENTLNGCVQSQGIKANIENWLIMGAEEWDKTPDQVKAWAYQAAGVTGWTDAALKNVLKSKLSYMDDDMSEVVLNILKDLSNTYKLETQ